MTSFTRRSLGAFSAAGLLGLALTACGGSGEDLSLIHI